VNEDFFAATYLKLLTGYCYNRKHTYQNFAQR
jgi:hypothetical protein